MTIYKKQVKTPFHDSQLALQGSNSASPKNPFVTKKDIVSEQRTGTTVSFEKDNVFYGTRISPITGDISVSLLNASPGNTIMIIHNDSVEPGFDTVFVKTSDSGTYQTGQLNYILCMFVDDGQIQYKINQTV